jgi:hypothetical protein
MPLARMKSYEERQLNVCESAGFRLSGCFGRRLATTR